MTFDRAAFRSLGCSRSQVIHFKDILMLRGEKWEMGSLLGIVHEPPGLSYYLNASFLRQPTTTRQLAAPE